jgi:hypothetical protein
MSKNYLNQRLGSGDGEREALMTRQMPYEPLPASVLFGASVRWVSVIESESLGFAVDVVASPNAILVRAVEVEHSVIRTVRPEKAN